MAITWYLSNGQPNDSIGVASDLAFDYANRIIWVKQSSNTWVGGGYSNIGPTGASPLITSGAPSNSYGANGNLAIDNKTGNLWYKSSGTWTQTGSLSVALSAFIQGAGPPNSTTAPSVSIGQMYWDNVNNFWYGPSTTGDYTGLLTSSPVNAQGPTGGTAQVQPTFGSYAQGQGPNTSLNNVTVSSTATAAYAMGTTTTGYFVPSTASAFVGGTIVNFSNSAGSLTFTLYNATTGASTGYSTTIARATVSNLGQIASTTYPLVAGNQYVWNVTGSGAAYCHIIPNYLYPSSYSGSVGSGCNAIISGTALSTTATNLSPPGLTLQYAYVQSPTPCYLYNALINVVGSPSAYCQVSLYTGSANIWTSPNIYASTSGTLYNSGIMSISTAYIAPAVANYWRITGSGSPTVNLQYQLAQ